MTTRSRRYLLDLNTTSPSVEVPTAQHATAPWVLLSRAYCHLCDDMLAAAREIGLDPTVIDVDQDEALVARWNDYVPVLLYCDAYVCHYHLDHAAVRKAVG